MRMLWGEIVFNVKVKGLIHNGSIAKDVKILGCGFLIMSVPP